MEIVNTRCGKTLRRLRIGEPAKRGKNIIFQVFLRRELFRIPIWLAAPLLLSCLEKYGIDSVKTRITYVEMYREILGRENYFYFFSLRLSDKLQIYGMLILRYNSRLGVQLHTGVVLIYVYLIERPNIENSLRPLFHCFYYMEKYPKNFKLT